MRLELHPRVWLNSIFDPIWPIEKLIFEAGISKENLHNQAIGRSQFEKYNFVRRYQGGREAYFFCIKYGIIYSSNFNRIDCNNREFKWLEAKIRLQDRKSVFSHFWILDGQICHLAYSVKTSARLFEGAEIESIKHFPIVDESIYTKIDVSDEIFDEIQNYKSARQVKNLEIELYNRNDAYEICLEGGFFVVVGVVSDNSYLLVPTRGNHSARPGYYFAGSGRPAFLSYNLSLSLSEISRHHT